jgi:hypothetical protein
LWKRPEVTRFCFEGLLKLISETKHEIKVLCVISELYYKDICEDYGFQWVFCDNNPLGNKINTGIKHSLSNNWDYLMMMNSDDIIKTELIDKCYQPLFEKKVEFFGVSKVTYVKFGTWEAREMDYGHCVLGIGKCIRRDVVERLKGDLYPPTLNRLLDDNMLTKMLSHNIGHAIVRYSGMLAMDFKSETNIWPWEHFAKKGIEVCYKHEHEEASATGK